MRVLVTGISSKIPNLVAERLLAGGHEVIGIDRRPWPGAPAGVQMHEVDIRKRAAEDVFRKTRPEVVVHMATVTHLLSRVRFGQKVVDVSPSRLALPTEANVRGS